MPKFVKPEMTPPPAPVPMPGIVQLVPGKDCLFALDEAGRSWRDHGGPGDAWGDKWQRLPQAGVGPGGRRCDVPRFRKMVTHGEVLFALDGAGGLWRLEREVVDVPGDEHEVEKRVFWQRIAVGGTAMPG